MENGNVVAVDEGRYLAAIGNVAGSQGNAVVQAVGKFVRHLGVEQDEAFNLWLFSGQAFGLPRLLPHNQFSGDAEAQKPAAAGNDYFHCPRPRI